MQRRRLGRSDLQVSPICFGGNIFGWTADEATSFRLLDGFLAAGANFIDTADIYSTWVPGHTGGESETIIGRWMQSRGNRDKVILATKVGSPMGPDKKGLRAAYIRTAVEASLRRLQTDYIDLYQSHRDDADTPQEETLGAYADLVRQGKVRVIGASNFTADRLRAALAISAKEGLPRYESLQPEYNLYARAGYEAELEPLCWREDVGVISYFSLASGFLTGKYRTEADFAKSPRGEDMGSYLNARGLRILAALDGAAKELKATPAQIAIAWLVARPGITAPIASATRDSQLADLIAGATLQIDPAIVARLDEASAGG